MTDQKYENENISFENNGFPIETTFSKYCLQTPPSRHSQAEIKYFVKGECVVVIDDETIVAREGDAVIISPFQRHYTFSTQGACQYHILIFDLDFLKSERICEIDTEFLMPFQEGKLIPKSHIRQGDPGHDKVVMLFDTLSKKQKFYQLSVKVALLRLFCDIMQSGAYSKVSDKKWKCARKWRDVLSPAMKYVEEHYRECITSEQLARVCNYNPKYFCKVFKQYTSKTAMDYVNSYRLHKAELEIISTDRALSDIAVDNGFFDLAHFSRYYKKTRGITPSQMRNGNRTSNLVREDK